VKLFKPNREAAVELVESADVRLQQISNGLSEFEDALSDVDKCAAMQDQVTIADNPMAVEELFNAVGRASGSLNPNQLLSSLFEVLKCYRKVLERKDKHESIRSMMEKRMQNLNAFYTKIMIAIGTQANLQFLTGNYTRQSVENTNDSLKTYSINMAKEREKIIKTLNPSSDLKTWGIEIAKHDKTSLLKQWCFLVILLSLDVSHVEPKNPLLDVCAKRNGKLIHIITDYTKRTSQNLFLVLSAKMGWNIR